MAISKKRCFKSIFRYSTVSLETVKTSSSLPLAIDTRAQMKCRAARLKKFFHYPVPKCALCDTQRYHTCNVMEVH